MLRTLQSEDIAHSGDEPVASVVKPGIHEERLVKGEAGLAEACASEGDAHDFGRAHIALPYFGDPERHEFSLSTRGELKHFCREDGFVVLE